MKTENYIFILFIFILIYLSHRITAIGDDISWGNAGNRDKKARREWVLDREDESDEDEEEGREQEVLLPLSVNTRKQPDTNTFIVLDSAKSSITENSGEHSPKRQRLCIHNNEDDNEIPEEVPRVVLESRNLAVQTSSHNDGARRMFQPPPRYIFF